MQSTGSDDIQCDADIHKILGGTLTIKKNGIFQSNTQTFSIGKHSLFKAQAVSLLHTGTFDVWTKDLDFLSICHGLNKLPRSVESKWISVGTITSPGLLFDRSTVRDHNQQTQAIVVYNNTSRTGELMNMKVAIPRIHKSHHKSLARIISNATELPVDCSQIIVDHLDLLWTETLEQPADTAHCHRIIQKHSQKDHGIVQVLRNKLPTWNTHINAYTLEFGGRALVPSVHNFQLVDDEERVVLQLGKTSETEYNVDFSFPLTPYQAFCICLSVIDRTFVWD